MSVDQLCESLRRYDLDDASIVRKLTDQDVLPAKEVKLTTRTGQSVLFNWQTIATPDGHRIGGMMLCRLERSSPFSPVAADAVRLARQQIANVSSREREVMFLLYEGCTNKAIALQLGISEKTVEKHRARIMKKLNVADSARLIRLISHAMLSDESDITQANIRD